MILTAIAIPPDDWCNWFLSRLHRLAIVQYWMDENVWFQLEEVF